MLLSTLLFSLFGDCMLGSLALVVPIIALFRSLLLDVIVDVVGVPALPLPVLQLLESILASMCNI